MEGLERWEQRQTRRRIIGTGKEASHRTLSMEVIGGKTICHSEGESPRSTEAGSCQWNDYRNHVTIGGSLSGVPGKWGACGWSLVQLDHDEELGPMHGMYGTLDAEFAVQRTIKRAELTPLLCLLRKADGPTLVLVRKQKTPICGSQ